MPHLKFKIPTVWELINFKLFSALSEPREASIFVHQFDNDGDPTVNNAATHIKWNLHLDHRIFSLLQTKPTKMAKFNPPFIKVCNFFIVINSYFIGNSQNKKFSLANTLNFFNPKTFPVANSKKFSTPKHFH